ncbi:hypothetical protein ERJ75_000502400 [Trypanosoma vivax]|nr:hypothetical protein ERJ75_000502400 [Trypanosoma vivax]
MKRGGHDLAKQFQTGCADERAEVVGILDPEKILDREGLHRWGDETKHLFVNQALELGRVPGLFVRHVVEEQVRAMEKVLLFVLIRLCGITLLERTGQ